MEWSKILRSKIIYILFFIISFAIYSYRLDLVPVHLNQDELEFALNAKLLWTNGRDQLGNFLPFYFWHLGSFWATPIIVYWTAIFVGFLGVSEGIIRLPSLMVGVISILLFVYLVKLEFKERTYEILAFILAITTPVFFIHSRLLLDNLY